MKQRTDFFYITLADFIARTAYQMGKTPLLPIFALSLGATDTFLGLIVSVSTITGMLLKPFIGALSDRWGRRWWLVAGTLFFVTMPFCYRFVQTAEQLFAIRLIHGLATAIYGPVTVAYVAEQSKDRRAERLGLFGMARSGGYIVGPAVAGWLLLTMDAVTVFTVIGLMSSLTFVPIFLLSESKDLVSRPADGMNAKSRVKQLPIHQQIGQALRSGSRTPAVWLSGNLEFISYIALYATKAFLPIYAITALGFNEFIVGLFFSVQEAAFVLLKPFGGRFGDRQGYLKSISIGMVLMGALFPLLTLFRQPIELMALAVLLGCAQALVFPSTLALVATQIDEQHMGAGMGMVGTLKNAGKVLGPILGGLLIYWLSYIEMFWAMGILLVIGAVVVYRRSFSSVKQPNQVQENETKNETEKETEMALT